MLSRRRRLRDAADDAGMTLVELVVGMTLMSIVGAMALNFFVGTSTESAGSRPRRWTAAVCEPR